MIALMAAEGLAVKPSCRLLEVTRAGYCGHLSRPPSARAIRHAWLTDLISEIHAASRGTYGAPRVHAELRLGRGVVVARKAVAMLMRRAGLRGLPARRRWRARPGVPDLADLVDRQFAVVEPDVLWVTDITEHPTREGKLYCCVVLDAFSRRVVGWSIDASQTAALVTNALRHGERGPLATSRHDRARRPRHPVHILGVHDPPQGLGAVGLDGDRRRRARQRRRRGLLGPHAGRAAHRTRWRTRVELANAMFEYLEVFHNRQRRHSALGMRTPIECEILHQTRQPLAS